MITRKHLRLITSLVVGASLATAMSSGHAQIATGTKFLGNIIANEIPTSFPTYWNQVTAENAGKWGSVEATQDVMDWYTLDEIYNYADSNSYPVRYHTLVWGSQEPAWVANLSPADQLAEVTEWIQEAGARYPSTAFVDVVNEPLHQPPSYKDAIGGEGATGWDWVIWSFEQARQAFPNAKLHINDYGIINDITAARELANIATILKERGLIDGIGLQCHYFNVERAQLSEMQNVLDTLAATGLPLYITELDMTGADNKQLSSYQSRFPVLWEHPAVQGITLWGYIEDQTWSRNAHLIRLDGSERPAMQWLRDYVPASGL
jgi:endo-1,4-beta-xylanase